MQGRIRCVRQLNRMHKGSTVVDIEHFSQQVLRNPSVRSDKFPKRIGCCEARNGLFRQRNDVDVDLAVDRQTDAISVRPEALDIEERETHCETCLYTAS